MTPIREILALLLRDYRRRLEREIESTGGFEEDVLPDQQKASHLLEWLGECEKHFLLREQEDEEP